MNTWAVYGAIWSTVINKCNFSYVSALLSLAFLPLLSTFCCNTGKAVGSRRIGEFHTSLKAFTGNNGVQRMLMNNRINQVDRQDDVNDAYDDVNEQGSVCKSTFWKNDGLHDVEQFPNSLSATCNSVLYILAILQPSP